VTDDLLFGLKKGDVSLGFFHISPHLSLHPDATRWKPRRAERAACALTVGSPPRQQRTAGAARLSELTVTRQFPLPARGGAIGASSQEGAETLLPTAVVHPRPPGPSAQPHQF
jgi:hypothetical protein